MSLLSLISCSDVCFVIYKELSTTHHEHNLPVVSDDPYILLSNLTCLRNVLA
jgi:hypothetical protein